MKFDGWQLRRVLAVNLFSYSTLEVDLPVDSTALVLGRNLDDSGADSNGAGKSSLFDIITWTVWGKTPRSEDFVADILRRGAEHASATVIFTDGERKFTITREKGQRNVLKASVNSEVATEDLTLRTVTLTQKAICKYLGYDVKKGFADYLSQVYFSTMSGKGFLGADVTPSERQQVLERFLGLGDLDIALKLVKDDLKIEHEATVAIDSKVESVCEMIDNLDSPEELTKRLSVIDKEIEHEEKLKASKSVLLSKLRTQVAVFDNAKSLFGAIETKFERIKNEARGMAEEYNKAQSDNESGLRLREEWEAIRSDYESTVERYIDYRERLAQLRVQHQTDLKAYEKVKQSIFEAEKLIKSVEIQLKHAQTCPECGTSLFVTDEDKIEKFDSTGLQKLLVEYYDSRDKIQGSITPFEFKVDKLNIEIAKITDVINELGDKKSEAEVVKHKYESLDLSAVDIVIVKAKEVDIQYQSSKIEFNEANIKFQNDLIEMKQAVITELNVAGIVGQENSIRNSFAQFIKSFMANIQTNISAHDTVIVRRTECRGEVSAEIVSLTGLQKTLKEAKKEIEQRGGTKAKLIYWSKIYPEIKRKLIDAFVPMFENTVNGYLSDLEIAERVRFSTEVDKRGSVGTKVGFVIEVFDGKHWARFQSYSGGERSRILVAVGFALRRLAQQRSSGVAFNFLLVDEILDNIDTTGMQYFFTLLAKITGQKFLITHTKIDDVIIDTDYQILVSKENGNSSIKVLS